MDVSRTVPNLPALIERLGERAPAPPRKEAAAGSASPAASLWDVLTPEERAFFAEQSVLGPITYRRGGAAPDDGAPAPIGQRIDVRG